MFSHLHTHSGFSFLYGTFSPTDLVVQVKNTGFAAVALTDKNGLYGAVRFYRTALEHQVKPIIGTEATVWNGSSLIGDPQRVGGIWLNRDENGNKEAAQTRKRKHFRRSSQVDCKAKNVRSVDAFQHT